MLGVVTFSDWGTIEGSWIGAIIGLVRVGVSTEIEFTNGVEFCARVETTTVGMDAFTGGVEAVDDDGEVVLLEVEAGVNETFPFEAVVIVT